jgi:hypothetical protein
MSTNTILATTPLVSTNYLLRATGTTIGNSLIFDNGTNVGIGNTNTSYTLDVSGTLRSTGAATLSSTLGVGTTISAQSGGTYTGSAEMAGILRIQGTGGHYFTTGNGLEISYNSIYSYNRGTNAYNDLTLNDSITVKGAGNVGIGTSSPASLLHIFGAGSGNSVTYTKYTCGDGGDIRVGKDSGVNNNAMFGTWSNNDVLFYGNQTERMRITSGGNVLIGTTTNATSPEILQVYGNIQFATGGITKIVESWGLNLQGDTTHPVKVNSAALLLGTSSNSSWTAGQGYKSGGGSWADSSDVRLKENIKTVENALDKITKIRGVTFDWKDEFVGDREKSSGGFIAQEVEEIFPEFVQERGANNEEKELINSDTIKTIYLPFTFYAYMVEAIKELSKQNEELSNRLNKLESK